MFAYYTSLIKHSASFSGIHIMNRLKETTDKQLLSHSLFSKEPPAPISKLNDQRRSLQLHISEIYTLWMIAKKLTPMLNASTSQRLTFVSARL